MKRSTSFLRTRKQAPAEEEAKNAQLLIRAGFIHKEMAGAYVLLPLGLKVAEKIKQIVREEMNSIGAEELSMTTLQRKELWQKTDRWDDKQVDIWFKSKLQNGNDVGLAWSHEEPIADMMREFISSYRDLPTYVYQFQNKLRNELRAKSGVMRCREFIMKDMYSLTRSQEEHQAFYDQAIAAYHRVFKRLGIDHLTYFTFASGGAFTQFSHEFQTVLPAGEDTIYLDKAKKMAINQEVMSDEVVKQLGLNKDKLEKVVAAEVGNIFSFGTQKSQALGLRFIDEKDQDQSVYLGSYGIGVTRLIGVIAELLADEQGLVWPAAIAPYSVYLANIGDSAAAKQATDEAYALLTKAGISVLYDERDERAGAKFADADLIGLPLRVIASDKTVDQKVYEIKARTTEKAKVVPADKLIETITAELKKV